MQKVKFLTTILLLILIVGAGWLLIDRSSTESEKDNQSQQESNVTAANIPEALTASFSTDFSNTSLDDFSDVLSGGPGKDGIPAISDPTFVSLKDSDVADTTRGILLEINGEKRFYPYNILVWHEIVNDSIGDTAVAVTFCPLCGSAIVYNRSVNGEVLDFGVSGYLRESNMIMFDRESETLWQQTTGEAFAGSRNGQTLERLQFSLVEMFEVKDKHPDAVVMSTDTGASRDYTSYPYGNYDNDEQLFFPVSVNDERFPAKEIFYVSTLDDTSVAVRIGAFENNGEPQTFVKNGLTLIISKDGGEVIVKDEDGNVAPGYYEMWFSWATWHAESGGVIINPPEDA